MSFLQAPIQPQNIPQTQPTDNRQIKNDAGGYVYSASDFELLDRFLIIGTVGGTYYADQSKLTQEGLDLCAKLATTVETGLALVKCLREVSEGGLALRQDYALVALAIAAASIHQEVRQAAYAAVVPVCRTASTLFQFVSYLRGRRGWSRGLRSAISAWYLHRNQYSLAYQVVKYRRRHGWTHKQLLQKVKPAVGEHESKNVIRFIVGKEYDSVPEIISRYMKANTPIEVLTKDEIKHLASTLPREALPLEWLNSSEVWEALLYGDNGKGMPLTALIRNLGKMTNAGLLVPNSDATRYVVGELMNITRIQQARIHPMALFTAYKTYGQGHGEKGSMSWSPVNAVIDALMHSFELALGNVTPTGKRLCVAVDSSGSMQSATCMGIPGTTATQLSAAMTYMHYKTEPITPVTCLFDTRVQEIKFASDVTLERFINRIPNEGGGTDGNLPFLMAKKENCDAAVIYTDGQIWASRNITQTIKEWRSGAEHRKALAVHTSTANHNMLDGSDLRNLNIAGFSADAGHLVTDFLR